MNSRAHSIMVANTAATTTAVSKTRNPVTSLGFRPSPAHWSVIGSGLAETQWRNAAASVTTLKRKAFRHRLATVAVSLVALQRLVGEEGVGGADVPPDAVRYEAANGTERSRQLCSQLGGLRISRLHRSRDGPQRPGLLGWPVDCDGISHICSFYRLRAFDDSGTGRPHIRGLPVTVGEHPAAWSRSDDDLSGPMLAVRIVPPLAPWRRLGGPPVGRDGLRPGG